MLRYLHSYLMSFLHMHFQVRGRGLKPKLVEQAIRLSHEKYCSASIMLGKTAEITEDYEIIEESAAG